MVFEKLKPHSYKIGIAAGYTAILAANVADPVMLPATIIGGLAGGLLVIGYLGYKHRKPAAKAIAATEESLETKLEAPAEAPVYTISSYKQTAAPLEMPALRKPETQVAEPVAAYKPKKLETPPLSIGDSLSPSPEDYFPVHEASKSLEMPLLKLKEDHQSLEQKPQQGQYQQEPQVPSKPAENSKLKLDIPNLTSPK